MATDQKLTDLGTPVQQNKMSRSGFVSIGTRQVNVECFDVQKHLEYPKHVSHSRLFTKKSPNQRTPAKHFSINEYDTPRCDGGGDSFLEYVSKQIKSILFQY